MPKHLLTETISVNLHVIKALIWVKSYFIHTVKHQNWHHFANAQVFDHNIKRLTILLHVENKDTILIFLVYLKVVEGLHCHLLDVLFKFLYEFFDPLVFESKVLVESNNVPKVEDHIFWEIIFLLLPSC